MKERYIYTPLQQDEIRLLEILPGQPEDPLQCHLRVVSLGDAAYLPLYAAVSYTWGEDLNNRTILVDGRQLSVKLNLEAALFEFRRKPPRRTAECVWEEVLIARKSVLGRLYSTPFSAASLANLSEIDTIWKTRDLSLKGDAETVANRAFLKDTEKIWNLIAGREGIPRLYEEPLLFWIDGICINQNDATERSTQVRRMARIYAQAGNLVIWLGLEDRNEDAPLRILDLFFRQHQQEKDLDNWLRNHCTADETGMICSFLESLFSLPWFKRAWIVQEYVLGALQPRMERTSSEPVVVCYGARRFRDLITKAMIFFGRRPDLRRGTGLSRALQLSVRRLQYRKRRVEQLGHDLAEQPGHDLPKEVHLLKSVAQLYGAQVTDPRDRIYSCLGLIDAYFNKNFGDYTPKGLIVDYDASVENIYSSFVRAVVEATKRLDILGFCTGKMTEHVYRTWTPDWGVEMSHSHTSILRMLIFGIPLVGNYIEELEIDVTPGTQCTATFANNLSTLTVSGFVCDRLSDQPFGIVRQPEDIKNMEEVFHARYNGPSVGGERRSEGSLLQRSKSGPEISDKGSVIGMEFKRKLLECVKLNSEASETDLEQFEKDLAQSTDLISLSQSTVKFHKDNSEPPVTVHGMNMLKAAPYYTSSLFLTDGINIVRPLTDDARPGDLICVILGCAMPMLLRPLFGYYELHGEVYVPGIMHGEEMAALREGKRVLQDFGLL